MQRAICKIWNMQHELNLRTNAVILVNVQILVDIFHYTLLRTDTGNMKSVDIHNMKCVT